MAGRIKSRVAQVLGFERNGVEETTKVDPGGGANKTADHYSPCGVDAPPLPGDSAVLTESSGTGTEACAAYSDPDNTRVARPGEHRVYARDEDGNVVGSGYWKRDGTIVFENTGGTLELSPAGILSANASQVRLTSAAGQPMARVGDLQSVVIPPLVVVDPVSGPLPVILASAAVPPVTGLPSIAAAGQAISGNNNVTG